MVVVITVVHTAGSSQRLERGSELVQRRAAAAAVMPHCQNPYGEPEATASPSESGKPAAKDNGGVHNVAV